MNTASSQLLIDVFLLQLNYVRPGGYHSAQINNFNTFRHLCHFDDKSQASMAENKQK